MSIRSLAILCGLVAALALAAFAARATAPSVQAQDRTQLVEVGAHYLLLHAAPESCSAIRVERVIDRCWVNATSSLRGCKPFFTELPGERAAQLVNLCAFDGLVELEPETQP